MFTLCTNKILSKGSYTVKDLLNFHIFTLLTEALPRSKKSRMRQTYWLDLVVIHQCAKTNQNTLNNSTGHFRCHIFCLGVASVSGIWQAYLLDLVVINLSRKIIIKVYIPNAVFAKWPRTDSGVGGAGWRERKDSQVDYRTYSKGLP